jgi:hypothetical protein
MSDDDYTPPGLVHISPEFAKLITEMFDREMDISVHRLKGEFPGLYIMCSPVSAWCSLCIRDYEPGLCWSVWNACFDQETEGQTWTNLDECLEVFDRVLLWDAQKNDELFPGLKWLPRGKIIDV